jgi:hypothetical protein
MDLLIESLVIISRMLVRRSPGANKYHTSVGRWVMMAVELRARRLRAAGYEELSKKPNGCLGGRDDGTDTVHPPGGHSFRKKSHHE